MGEEDMFNESHPFYTGTLKCTSQIGKVYKISREHFSSIKTQPGSYLVLVNQILKKNKRKHIDFIDEKNTKAALRSRRPSRQDK
jgi:hypothetical protein|tara:strand:+ start:717 stop:968 length:252 start_codon:yes stop_codon:yes gene_type:complete